MIDKITKEIKELASDPPAENERRRGFYIAIEGVLRIIKKYKQED